MTLHVGETGKTLRFASALDMSSNTELTLTFELPDGTTVTKTKTAGEVTLGISALTDPDLGPLIGNQYVEYVVESGFLSQAGTWQAKLTYTNTVPAPDDIFIGNCTTFTVVAAFDCTVTSAEKPHIFVPRVVWSIEDESYDGSPISVAPQTAASAVFIGQDGTTMYTLDRGSDTIRQYALSTPGDSTTASYANKTVDLNSLVAAITAPTGMFFDPGENLVWILDETTGTIYELILDVSGDIDALTYSGVFLGSVALGGLPQGLWVNSAGTKMLVAGSGDDKIFQLNSGTGWSLTDFSALGSLDISSQGTTPRSVFCDPPMSKMFFLNAAGINAKVFQYTVGTPGIISTGVYDDEFMSVEAEETGPGGIYMTPTKLQLIGEDSDQVHQYSL